MLQALILLTVVFSTTESRGPHHPRGEAVSKHHVHYRPTRNVEKLTQDEQLIHDQAHMQVSL